MPIHAKELAFATSLVLLSYFSLADAQSPAADKPQASSIHHAVKSKTHAASPFAVAGVMREDDWFSLGPPKEAEIEKEAPGVQIKVHDPHEDDIVVYGLRQKRDFEGATPAPNLTSPHALDAAQPLVPGIGDSCSYKYGCFDSGQTPLRSSLFGD
jgi:hypothetical protein